MRGAAVAVACHAGKSGVAVRATEMTWTSVCGAPRRYAATMSRCSWRSPGRHGARAVDHDRGVEVGRDVGELAREVELDLARRRRR